MLYIANAPGVYHLQLMVQSWVVFWKYTQKGSANKSRSSPVQLPKHTVQVATANLLAALDHAPTRLHLTNYAGNSVLGTPDLSYENL